MDQRTLGRTQLRVSAFTFGCGAIGGLMVRATEKDQREAVAMALDAGVNVFDTAPFYGDGASEANLGRALGQGRPGVVVTTKVRLAPGSSFTGGAMAGEVAASLEGSLRRLGRERVDVLQLHHPVTNEGARPAMTPGFVVNEIAPALQRLQAEGKVGFIGLTALGDASAIRRVVESGAFDTAQVAFNLLNPTAGGMGARQARATDDYDGMLAAMADRGMGAIGIRILAGGALSGTMERDPVAAQKSIPVGQGVGMGADYAADVAAARAFEPVIDGEGTRGFVDLALRYTLSNPLLNTLAVGLSSLDQLRQALASFERGPLSADTLARIAKLQSTA